MEGLGRTLQGPKVGGDSGLAAFHSESERVHVLHVGACVPDSVVDAVVNKELHHVDVATVDGAKQRVALRFGRIKFGPALMQPGHHILVTTTCCFVQRRTAERATSCVRIKAKQHQILGDFS